MIKSSKRIVALLLLLFLLFGNGIGGVEVFARGNSSIVFSKCRKPTKKIALTFDDGPHPRYTERILDILAKYNVKATFFVIGVNILNYPEPLCSIHAAGHEIGNHSFSHNNRKDLDGSDALLEMQKCEDLIYRYTKEKPKLFRPPRGSCNDCVEQAADSLGYSVVLWSIDTLDWKNTPSGEISKTVLGAAKGGDIILMHDYTSGTNTTCDALEIIIPRLLSEGFEFVTVSELIKQAY